MFFKEPHINTETYKQAMNGQLDVNADTGDTATDKMINIIVGAVKEYQLALAERQIRLAFEQSEKEVSDLSVSFEDGHKFQQKSTELQEMKDLSDKICLEHGLGLTQKGRTFDGKKQEETTSYKKEQYRLLQRAERGEVKSYVQDIVLAVMDCREQAKSREQFIELMNNNGYVVVWMDNRKYITFTDLARQKKGEKQCKIRNSKLEKYYYTDFSKNGLEHEFADNARKQQEKHSQTVRATTIVKYGRVAVIDTRTVLKESGAVLD